MYNTSMKNYIALKHVESINDKIWRILSHEKSVQELDYNDFTYIFNSVQKFNKQIFDLLPGCIKDRYHECHKLRTNIHKQKIVARCDQFVIPDVDEQISQCELDEMCTLLLGYN